jgi:hypothetical protein
VGFVKTTWVPGRAGGTQFTAAQMNRLEQGIADLYAYKGAKRRDTLNATTWDVAGLDGATHKGYDLTITGLYGAATDNSPYLTLVTPAQSYTKSRMWEVQTDTADNTTSGVNTSRSGVGVALGQTYDGANGRNYGLIKLSVLVAEPTSGNAAVLVTGQAMWRSVGRPAGTPGFRAADIFGIFEHAAGNVTAIRFNWDNSPFSGSVLIEPWVGSF